MAEEQNQQRDENQDAGFDQAEEEYLSWKKNAPLLYDTLISHLLDWPATSCQYFSKIEDTKSKGYIKQHFAIGTTTSEENVSYLGLMSSTVPVLGGDANGMGKGGEAGAKPHHKCIKMERRIPHPGDVNKLRICPTNQRIIATKSDNTKVYLWDCESVEAKPILSLNDHTMTGYALDWNCIGNCKLVSADNKGTICLYTFEQEFEVRAEHADSTQPKQEPSKPPTKPPTAKYENNGAAVNDCRFQRVHGSIFGAVSDDCTITLWDIRAKSNPFFRILGHTNEVFCMDFAHNDEFLLLTGGSDRLIKLWDIRKIIRPVHEFSHHREKVLRVEWNPTVDTVFASCGEDRTVNLWDCSCIGNDVTNDDNMDGPPELLFSHKGHKGVVEDMSWNPGQEFGMLSCDSENLLQIWEIDDKIYYAD